VITVISVFVVILSCQTGNSETQLASGVTNGGGYMTHPLAEKNAGRRGRHFYV